MTAEDWVEAAYRAMAGGGVEAVAVEPLARKLGVTKGSFYWHFGDRKVLLEAVLGRWEKEYTEARIAAAREVADPRGRLTRLGEEVFGEVPTDDEAGLGEILIRRTFELAVSDAADDPIVGPFLRRVTERRIGFLEECYLALGLPEEVARNQALLAYAAYAGTVRLFRDAPDLVPRGESYAAYRRHLFLTLWPPDDAGATEKIRPLPNNDATQI